MVILPNVSETVDANDELLDEQNVSKNMLPAEFFKDTSSVEYIFLI